MTCSLASSGESVAWTRRRLACLAVLGIFAPVLSAATTLAEPDASAVREVVEAQLKAFAADDAERAFSYASAGIRSQFGDAATFMSMVRAGYPMVVRPAAVSFLQAQTVQDAGGAVSQPVHLRDSAGRFWKATYLLEQQAGTGWRISGCVVVADSAKSMT
jgi:Domain of unknown function (DUF4864)